MKNILAYILALASLQVFAAPVIFNSAEYAKFLTTLGWQLNDGKMYRSLTVDPTAGAGVSAPIGSVGVRDNSGTAEMWVKIGSADTSWSNVLTAATGWSLTGNAGTTGSNFLGTTDGQTLQLKSNSTLGLTVLTTGALKFDQYTTGIAHLDADGDLTSSLIANADVDASAGIARSKMASGTGYRILANDSSGVMSENAALTPAHVVYADANGQLAGEAQLSESRGGTGIDGSGATNGQLLIGNGTGFSLAAITGTANQVGVTNGAGTITLSTPQDIHTGASPTFAGATIGTLTGVIKGSSGVLSASDVDLTAEVTGVLPIANGGSNKALTLAAGGVLWSDADSFEVSAAGSSGQILQSTGTTAPAWTTSTYPSTGGTAGNVIVSDGTNFSAGELDLSDADATTGTLPVGSGGTNSSASLNNNRVMISSSGSIVEHSALTQNQIVYPDSNGLPTGEAAFTYDPSTNTQTVDVVLAKSSLQVEDSDAGTNKVTIQASTSLAGDYTLTLPTTDGDANQFLQTDGSGGLTWADATAGRTVVGSRGTPEDITAAGGISAPATASDHLVYVQGDGGAINITANPQIGDGLADGQELCVRGRSNDNTVTLEHGTGLVMNGAAELGQDDQVCFMWDTSAWVETNRNF